jgi:hypothetical protein
VARGRLGEPVGRQIIEQFLAAYMKDSLRGPPRIVSAPGFSFSDVPAKVVSVINLASVRDLERVVGQPVDPLRFRANVYVDGLSPWAEKAWVGRKLALGEVEAEVVKAIMRCAAINVNPKSAERDMNLLRALEAAFGENACGVYLAVRKGGRISEGGSVSLLDQPDA